MSSILAIVSKPLFEQAARAAGKPIAVGETLALDRYLSLGKGLDGLAAGGALFLVTVRSDADGEHLWLVGILEAPARRDDGWYAAPSRVAIRDVSALRDQLRFTSGKGLSAKAGALAMSLQTPRELTDDDVALLREAKGKAKAKGAAAPAPVLPARTPPSPKATPVPSAGGAIAALLAKAREAVSARNYQEALTLLLRVWAKTPAPAIAEAIEAVGARAMAGLEPPSGKTAKERNQAWADAARAGDPVVRGVLLATLTDTKGSGETLERIDLLVPHGPDPRLSARLAGLIEVPIYNASVSRTTPFWKRLFELLPLLGDARIAARVAQWPALWAKNKELNPPEPPELKKRLGKVLPQLQTMTTPALADGDAALAAAVVAALGAAPAAPKANSDEAELLAAVWAAPERDEPRLVYADWLQERGDVRGEFITLQFARHAGTQTREQSRREKDLLAEFGERWLGPLRGKVLKSDLGYERGFVSEATVAEGVDDDPAWSTLCALARGVPAGAAMPLLTRVSELANGHLGALSRQSKPLAIEDLEWFGPSYYQHTDFDADGQRAVAAFAKIRVLPRLRRLVLIGSASWAGNDYQQGKRGITVDQLAWAWSSPACAGLEELQFPASLTRLAEIIKAVSAGSSLQRLVVRSTGDIYGPRAIRTLLTRDADGLLTRAHIVIPDTHRSNIANWGDQLATLPTTLLTHLEVEVAAETWKAVEDKQGFLDALARQTRLDARPKVEKVGRVRLP